MPRYKIVAALRPLPHSEHRLHAGHTFPKSERLQHGHEFRAVYERGRKAVGRLAVLYVVDESMEPMGENKRGKREGSGVGVVTGRAIGGAVQRNRARRLLREAYRLNKHKLKPSLRMVMVARTAIAGKPFSDVETELLNLFRTAGILIEP